MRTVRLAVPLVVLACMTASTWAEMKPKVPVVVCPRVQQAPTMDGRIDPAEWAAAGCLSDFMLLGAEDLPTLPTRVYVMHTADSLFLGAQMFDNQPGDLVAEVAERDGKVYEDDCLEVFIDTERSRTDYAHFVVNSLGTRFDAYTLDMSENFEWNVFAAMNDTGWAIEMELPFDQGIPPSAGEIWNLAVCRNAARAGELSTWARHERGFHEPGAFGEMIFVAPLLSAKIDDPGDRAWGDNLALATVQNLSDQPLTTKLYAVVMGPDRRSHYFGTVKHALGARESAQVYVPYKVQRCGPAWLTLSLTDEKGNVAWRSAALPIDLPNLSEPLDNAAHEIAVAWKYWSTMEPSEEKDQLKQDVDAIQKRWRYIDKQLTNISDVETVRLTAMAMEAASLSAQAALVRGQAAAAAPAWARERFE